MYVDKNLQVANTAPLAAGSLIAGSGLYIYLSDTIPLGNGTTKGSPIGNSVWTVMVDDEWSAASPPCICEFNVISGATASLIDDLVAGTYSVHYATSFGANSRPRSSKLLEFVIDPGVNLGTYQKYLGVFATFSGSGLDSGSWTIQCTMNAGVTVPIYPADALPN